MDKIFIEGSCLCGNITFKVDKKNKWCANCHCTRCQRSHGSGFVTWIGVVEHACHISEDTIPLKWYSSSKRSQYGFCPICGTSLFYRSEKYPGEIDITLANVSSKHKLKPTGHAYFDTHVDWLVFDDDLERSPDPKL